MRNTALLILFASVINLVATAQQGFVSLSGAYAFGTGGVIHPMFEQSAINGNEITTTAQRLTLGTGFHYRGDIRYFFNDYLGIGIQGTVMRGSWQQFSSDRKIVFIQHTAQTVRAGGFALSAAFHARMGENVVIPYLSLFPGFYTGTMDLVDSVSYSGQLRTSRWEYNSLTSPFLSMAAGLDVMVNEELCFFVEAEFQSMTVAPRSATMTILNGDDDLSLVPLGEKRIVFMDEITSDYTVIPDENLPRKVLRPYFPLDSFQVRVGVRVSLVR